MRKLALLTLIAVPACAEESVPPEINMETSEIRVIPRGPTCADLGIGDHEFVITDPADGTYQVDDLTRITLIFDSSGSLFRFSSSAMRFDAVLASAGDKTGLWHFDKEMAGYSNLFAPTTPGTWPPPPPEELRFCYDYELRVNPNAYAAYSRRHDWSIEKTGVSDFLTLSAGQTYLASYDVTVTMTGAYDAGATIDGPVFIHNETPFASQIDGVTVDVGGIAATVNCPVAFPWTLNPGAMIECRYIASVPDTTNRLVTIYVATPEGVATASELGNFGSHTTKTTLVDECVDVYDDHVGWLGKVCVNPGTATFHYTMEIGPYDACGPFEVVNIASFVGIDTGATGNDSWIVGGEVPCDDGCSLTPGYWKTHSERGPAPYDATWAKLPNGADTAFFSTGVSYYTALWTSPQGNAYWILAHAYIAAKLNGLNEADVSSIQSTFDQATALLQSYLPGQITNRHPARAQFLSLATTLDNYNNGLIGPGHCSE
jgi:hypothetical protein